MFIDWQCVYDDGARPFAEDVPLEQRRPLGITLGEDVTIRISLVNPAGAPAKIADGGWLELTLRDAKISACVLLVRRSTIAVPGYQIAIAAVDLNGYAAQRGTFDLWAIEGAARRVVVQRSELVISGAR